MGQNPRCPWWMCGAVASVLPLLLGGVRPPVDVRAGDHPNDAGTAIDVRWSVSPDDVAGVMPRQVLGYEIQRAETGSEAFKTIGVADPGATEFLDSNALRGASYAYRVVAIGVGEVRSEPSDVSRPATATLQYVDYSRLWYAGILATITGLIVLFLGLARAGYPMRLRKIAGLEAIDEAVGRATEMGRSCVFVAGVQDIDDIMTIAGLTVLSRVGQTAAEYECRVQVPTARPLVMTAARETLQAAAFDAGRPEAYNADDVYYLSNEQFAFAAAVTGQMVREEPAACFYFGAFFAESLFLAETGNAVGALQIAGTAESTQLPFFVAACDYVLIGEEFFAASAYLSGAADQMGTLKGQDAGKVVAVVLIVAGSALATWSQLFPQSGAGNWLRVLTEQILGSG